MQNYELKPHLKYMVLSECDGEMEWTGTDAQRGLVEAEIKDFEDKYHGV